VRDEVAALYRDHLATHSRELLVCLLADECHDGGPSNFTADIANHKIALVYHDLVGDQLNICVCFELQRAFDRQQLQFRSRNV